MSTGPAEELHRLLGFGRGASRGAAAFPALDARGRPDPEAALQLWITARMTYVHSLGHLLHVAGSEELAHFGVDALRRFETPGAGFAATLDAEGRPDSGPRMAYDLCFVVLAGAGARVARVEGGAALLDDALEELLGRFWDDEHGMLVEERAPDGQGPAPGVEDPGYRGANANMHGVEVLLAAADALEVDGADGAPLRERALRITTRIVGQVAPAYAWRIPEHFDAEWRALLDYHVEVPADPFRPYGATVGHWLEWSRLCLQLRAGLGAQAPDWLLEHAVALFDAAVREGWAVDGADGFVYTVDFEGVPVVRQRMHWVVAEALCAATALHGVTGDESYAAWHARWWAYATRHLVDLEHGSWHHELAPDNTPDGRTWPGKPDLYHAVGACLAPRLPLRPTTAVSLRQGLLSGG